MVEVDFVNFINTMFKKDSFAIKLLGGDYIILIFEN
jgi:hypothetical protein